MTLHLEERVVSVPFHAVSMELMRAFARILRRRAGPARGGAPEFPEVSVEDVMLRSLLAGFRREGEVFTVGAFQAQAPLFPLDRRRRPRGLSARPVLPALAVAAGDGELMLLRRREASRGRGEGLGYGLMYLPLGRIRSLRLEDDPAYAARRLTAALDHGEVVCRFALDNPTAERCRAGIVDLL